VAAFFELVNELYRYEEEAKGTPAWREAVETLIALMNPFTPHVAEEMWRRLGHVDELVDHPWPVADAAVAREDEVELAVQVNGKVRSRVVVPAGAPEEDVKARALADPRVAEHIEGKSVQKVMVVPGRLVSVVVK
jgi:leucyl-tRNA synthetase